jgi:hypothetical protein
LLRPPPPPLGNSPGRSSILLTNLVGVGSSGSLMGMLGAWVVFIIYTWCPLCLSLLLATHLPPSTHRRNKVPPESRCQRNCQLFSVLVTITVTVPASPSPLSLTCPSSLSQMMFTLVSFVDWAAHAGGLIQGVLLGIALLSGEIRHWGYRVSPRLRHLISPSLVLSRSWLLCRLWF